MENFLFHLRKLSLRNTRSLYPADGERLSYNSFDPFLVKRKSKLSEIVT